MSQKDFDKELAEYLKKRRAQSAYENEELKRYYDTSLYGPASPRTGQYTGTGSTQHNYTGGSQSAYTGNTQSTYSGGSQHTYTGNTQSTYSGGSQHTYTGAGQNTKSYTGGNIGQFTNQTRLPNLQQPRPGVGNTNRKKSKSAGCIAMILVPMAAIFFFFGIVGAVTDSDEGTRCLCYSYASTDEPWDEPFLTTDITRKDVLSVTFLASCDSAPEDTWDVSKNGDDSVKAWAKENGEYYDIYIAADGKINGAYSCNKLFSGCKNLKEINFNGNFDTADADSTDGMFEFCTSLETVDLSGFNTEKTKSMAYMFYKCSSLKEIDVAELELDSLTDMCSMFSDCSSLKTIDLSGHGVQIIDDMEYTFSGCSALEEFITGDTVITVTDATGMFGSCKSLETLDLSGFDFSEVEAVDDIFKDCPGLKEVNLRTGTGNAVREQIPDTVTVK